MKATIKELQARIDRLEAAGYDIWADTLEPHDISGGVHMNLEQRLAYWERVAAPSNTEGGQQ